MMFLLSITAVEVLKWIGYVLVALLCLMVMVVIHETGHFLVGKLFHFTILEYSIGFGPKIFQKENKDSGEKFSIRCIPLGGYCQFKDENEDGSLDEGAFNAKPVWQRILVLVAGAAMNFITAVIFISIFFMAYGDFLPKVYKTYDYVDEAYVQQFEVDDVIYEIDGKMAYSLLNQSKLKKLINGKETVTVTVMRDGEFKDLQISLQDYYGQVTDSEGNVIEVSGKGLGISVSYEQIKLSFFKALGHAFEFIGEVVVMIFKTLGSVFTGSMKVSQAMGGTVTTISVLSMLVQNGFMMTLYGVCILSASLGVSNLFPIPALDGGRIVFCIIEGIRGKPMNRKVEGILNVVGLVLLLVLAIVLDLLHFLG